MDKLLKEIEDYCLLNKLDFKKELNKMLRSSFTTLKYGSTPSIAKKNKEVLEPIKIEEVIKETKKEVPPIKGDKLDMYGE